MTQSDLPQTKTILRILTVLNTPDWRGKRRFDEARWLGSSEPTMKKLWRAGLVYRTHSIPGHRAAKYYIEVAGIEWLAINAPKGERLTTEQLEALVELIRKT